VETATRFPLLHTPDGGYLNSEIVIGLVIPGPIEMLVFDQNLT